MRALFGMLQFYPKAKRQICNGIGPKRWAWLFPLWFAPNRCFHEAADLHDFLYWVGGRVRDKLAADWAFLKGCLSAAWQRQGWRCAGLVLVALLYFSAVLAGGWLCFHWGRQRGVEELERLEDPSWHGT